jgi:hypothetical protein
MYKSLVVASKPKVSKQDRHNLSNKHILEKITHNVFILDSTIPFSWARKTSLTPSLQIQKSEQLCTCVLEVSIFLSTIFQLDFRQCGIVLFILAV